MASGRGDRISDLYHAALARATGQRDAILGDACGGDEALRQEVQSLLRYESASAQFLETVAAVAADALDRTDMLNRQLGPHAIVAPLGASGMGEVYRARDSTLGRDVAIKVLPSDFTADIGRTRNPPVADLKCVGHPVRTESL
jgi:eukaryotic-like serine/threonine-protein kinase